MTASPRFATLQARLQARHGQRLDPAQWNRLAAVTTLEAFVARARETTLGGWLEGVDPNGDVHHLEEMMRELFLRQVALVAGLTPREWQPAVRWVATLADLPTARHRHFQGADHPWMARLEGLEHLETPPIGQDSLTWWLDRWQKLWPKDPGTKTALTGLIRLAHATQERMATRGENETFLNAWFELRGTLELRFRRHAMGPGALFIHLWLMAMDLHRLRGELCRRRLFAAESGP
ncbi:MAG: V-type ATPase subunit [Magnetococcales bacterium]|nr:V-type ATPase subunit [Magnetococcales bacterium]